MNKLFPLILVFLLSLSMSEPLIPVVKAEAKKGDITFMPNVMPELTIHVADDVFKFRWLKNRFDLVLYIGYNESGVISELGIHDFWKATGKTVRWSQLKRNVSESAREFGYVFEDIPSVMADRVEYLLWRIEKASFKEDEIEMEIVEVFENMTEPCNITRFLLPDNLVLSYEDLYRYGFTVSHPSNVEAKVEGVKGKASWNLDPITYSSPTMTFIGTTTNLFWEFWNASNVNGWGVAHNNNNTNTQFEFDCLLQIGDGSTPTTASDTNKQVTFVSAGSYQNMIRVHTQATLTLGTLISDSDKTVKDGCELRSLESSNLHYIIHGYNGIVNLYGTTLSATTTATMRARFRYIAKLYHVQYCNGYDISFDNADSEIYDLLLTNYALFTLSTALTTPPQYVYSYGCTYGAYLGANDVVLENFVGRAPTFKMFRVAGTTQAYIINADVDSWTFTFIGGTLTDVYRQYSFDLTITYPNGTVVNGTSSGCRVTLRHYGQGGAVDYNATLGADGTITQQTLSMGFYNQTGGNTPYSYEPFNLRVWNCSGYQDINMNFTLDAQTDWTKALSEEIPTETDPVARFNMTSETIYVDTEVSLNGSMSYDPDGGSLTDYSWNFGDGNTTSGAYPTITHRWSSAGVYSVNLTVTDDESATDWFVMDVNVTEAETTDDRFVIGIIGGATGGFILGILALVTMTRKETNTLE